MAEIVIVVHENETSEKVCGFRWDLYVDKKHRAEGVVDDNFNLVAADAYSIAALIPGCNVEVRE